MFRKTSKKILAMVLVCVVCAILFGLYKYSKYQDGVKAINDHSTSFINTANSSLQEIDDLLNNEGDISIEEIEQSIAVLKADCTVMEVLLNDMKFSAEKSNVKIFEHLYTNVIDGVEISIVSLEDYDSNEDNIMIGVGLRMSQREIEESITKLKQMM